MRNILLIVSILLIVTSCRFSDKKLRSQTTPVCISDTTKQASCVYLTADEKEQPVVSWCETDKSSGARSWRAAFFDQRNGGFSDPIAVPIEQHAALHEEGMPKLAFKRDGTIIGIYETSVSTQKNKFAGSVYYIVSRDRGRSWSAPVRLHADTTADNSHSFASIARLGDGEIGACWLDQSLDGGIGRPVKFAKTNRDNQFGNEMLIDSLACECCRIAMASNAEGKIAIAFRDIMNDSIRDISISSSGDNGQSFSPAVSFSNDGWSIDGCPHNGPSLAVAGGAIYAAWFTGGPQRGVYYGELNASKEIVSKRLISGEGRFIQLCLLKDGSRVLAYNENIQDGDQHYAKIILNKIDGGNLFTETLYAGKSTAAYPVVQSFGENNIVVAWTDKGKAYYQLIFRL